MAYRVLMGRRHPFLLLEGRTGERCAHEAPRRGIRKDGTWYTYGWDLTKKAPEGPEGDWTNAQHLPEGRGAVGRLRVNMGRRHTRKITVNDNVTNHLRYIYRGYLQIAAINAVSGVFQWFIRRESARRPPKGHLRQQVVRAISQMRSICPAGASARGAGTRQPTQPVATRPLGIRKDGTWYTYGWDLTKNICESARRPPKGRLREQAVRAIGQTRSVCPAGARSREAAPSQVFSSGGTILTAYTYTPYGAVTANGNVTQPIQWSSEYNDSELGLVYYNYRHYHQDAGRWIGRDRSESNKTSFNRYGYCSNSPDVLLDYVGKDIYHVLDEKGAEDFGHSMYVIGNDKDGYNVYSYAPDHSDPSKKAISLGHNFSTSPNYGGKPYAENIRTLGEAMDCLATIKGESDPSEWKTQKWETSRDEDRRAKQVANEYVKKKYYLL